MLAGAQWVVLLNNDVVACDGAIDAMLDAAEQLSLDVVSPALVEGPMDYDFAAHALAFRDTMRDAVRRGWFHGVCFAIDSRNRRMGLGWWQRRLFKVRQRRQTAAWARGEAAAHGMTLHMLRADGGWTWQ